MKGEPAGVFYGIGPAFTMLARAYMGDRGGGAGRAAPERARRGVGPQVAGSASLLRPMIRAARNSGLGYRGLLGLMLESRSMRTRGLLPRPGRPNTGGSWTVLFCAVEALAVLGEKAEAAKLYPLVLEGMKTGNLFRGFDMRLLDTLAGIAAGCGGKWAEAEEHFRTALRRAEELPHVIEQPEVAPLVRLDAPRTRRARRPREGAAAADRGDRDVPPHRHAEARRDGGGDAATGRLSDCRFCQTNSRDLPERFSTLRAGEYDAGYEELSSGTDGAGAPPLRSKARRM